MREYQKIKSILFLLLLAFSGAGYAQQAIVTGIVRDNMGPMFGVTVYMQNENNRMLVGVSTNLNGEYYLTIPTGSGTNLELVFSFVGYKSQKVKYTGQKTVNATLEEDTRLLEQVTVTGRKTERSSAGIPTRNLGEARQRIEMEEMEGMQVTSIEDALQGRLGNVDIVASSGDPGSKMSIRIRGTSSLNASNEPLIVVDGIPYETEINDDFDFQTANEDDFGALVNISPNDIEAIEVLKDAAATALWGSKGANGVLIITTKRGSVGKTRFTINQKVDYKWEPDAIPMLNGGQYVTMIHDAMWNRMKDVGFHWSEMDNLTRYPEINFDPDYRYFKEYSQNTNWVDLIKKNAYTSETNFSMTGGGEKALYRFSLGYLSEGGTTKGSGFERISARLNVDYNFSTKLRVSAGFSFAQGNREDNWRAVRGHAMNKMPNMSPYKFDEKTGELSNEYFIPAATTGYTPFQGVWANEVFNPLAMANESENNTQGNDVRVTFNLNYQFMTGLLFSSDIGFDINTKKTVKYLPAEATGLNVSSNDYNREDRLKSDNMALYINNRLVYEKRYNEDHQTIVTFINQLREGNSSNVNKATKGTPDGGRGVQLRGQSGVSKSRTLGFVLNGHYNFRDKYMVTAGYRLDGNSRMGKENRWGWYPNVQLAWRFSKENLLSGYEWLSDSKLRLSWGKSGNSPSGSYPYVGSFSASGNYLGESAVSASSIQLNNLKWETVTQKNIGLDLSFLADRLGVTVDVYDKVSTDVLQKDAKISTTTGFTQVAYFNSGEIRNKGWEFRVDFRNIIKTADFSLGANINVSRNRNTVEKLPENMEFEKYTFGNGNYAQNIVIGDPLGSFYGYKYNGVYQNKGETVATDQAGQSITDMGGRPVYTTINNVEMQPGDARYEDMNHDGVIDRYDIVYLGNSMPILTGGFGINMAYKNFRLRSFFQGRIGQNAINRTRINTENMYTHNNQSAAVLKRWRHEGDQTDIPRALWQRGYNYLGSDRFVDDASFVRMKQLTLSYSPNKAFLNKLGISRAEIYLTGYDLWTITNYKGQNPEVGFDSSSSLYQLAVDNADTPRPVRIAVGVTVDF